MATKFVSLDKLSHFLLKLKDEFVVDKSYVHTDSNYTATDKAKVANLPDNTTTALEGKVDKVSGKGLSTEDYTST